MPRFHLCCACVLLLSWPALALAQQDDSWTGKKVMLKEQGVKLRAATEKGVPLVEGITRMVYKVLDEKMGWLKVRQGAVEGWFPKEAGVLLDDAVALFTDRIAVNPNDVNAYASRAAAWDEKGEVDLAIRDHDEAIRLLPNVGVLWSNRGNAYMKKKDHDKALGDYTEAIRLDPGSAFFFNNRGHLYSTKKEFDKAIQDYTEAIRLDAKLPLAYLNRGLAYNNTNQMDKALEDYNEAIRLNPEFALAYSNRGIVWWRMKEFDKGIGDCTTAIKLDPALAAAYSNRGLSYSAKQDYGKALHDYQAAIKIAPKFAGAHNNMAWILATCPKDDLRDGKKAIEHAAKACELTSWKTASHLDTLAAAYAEDGQFDLAVKWQAEALESADFLKTSGEAAKQRLQLFQMKKPYREK